MMYPNDMYKEYHENFKTSDLYQSVKNQHLKMTTCSWKGEGCWCRGVSTVDGKIIIYTGEISKEEAKEFVNIHNNKLRKDG